MKRKILLLFLLFFSTGLYSSGFYNFGDFNQAPGVFFGASYFFGSRNIILGDDSTKIYSLEYVSYDGFVGISAADSIAFYFAAGFNDFKIEDNMNGEYDLKFTGGIRLKVIEFLKIALKAGEAESRTFDLSIITDFNISYFKGSGTTVPDSVNLEVEWVEYQATLSFNVDVDPFLFYLGSKFSFLDGTFTPAFNEQTEFSNDGFFSFLAGSAYNVSQNIRFGAEVSIFAETSIGANLQFYF